MHNLITGENFKTIMEAINDPDTKDGHLITIDSGVYVENLIIRKSLTIRSTSGRPKDTIIQGKDPKSGSVFFIEASYVNVSGFTIIGAYQGIYINRGGSCYISNNIITNTTYGILIRDASYNNIISDNWVNNNAIDGISIWSSKGNIILRNNVSGNGVGIHLEDAEGNIIYLNNFIGNRRNVFSYKSTSIWSSIQEIKYTYNGGVFKGFLGNYWSDYSGRDDNRDGVGDVPYNIDSEKDNYPLVSFFGKYEFYKARYYLKVESIHGVPQGEGWYYEGTLVKVFLRDTIAPGDRPGERHIFAGWSGDIQSENSTIHVKMDGNKTVNANWKRQFFLIATTPFSGFEGGNDWYDEGSKAVLKLRETAVGFLIRNVFDHFEGLSNIDKITKLGEVEIYIDGPREIRAIWKQDYTQLLIVAIILVCALIGISFALKSRKK